MDPTERALFVAKVMAGLGLAAIALALLGEYLGWWNDWGLVLGIAGIIATGLGVAIAVLVTASRWQVKDVGHGVQGVHQAVDVVGTKIDSLGGKMDRQTGILEEIRDRLPPPGNAPG